MRQTIEYAKMALRNILANKMRSILTMLGIIIGISSVIIVLSLGTGGQRSIQSELSSISNGSVYIMVYGDDSTGSDYITDDDLDAIADIPGMAGVTMVTGVSATARATREEVPGYVNVGGTAMNTVLPTVVKSGRHWDESDYAAGRKVCTVDEAGAKELFGSDNVVGMTVRLEVYGRSADFTIIGITQSAGQSFPGSVSAEISAPQTALSSLTEFVEGPYYQIALLGEVPTRSAALADQAVSLLELRHDNAGRDVYQVMDVSQYMDQFNNVISLIAGIIAAIAGISLLVGGIGVMNIMLVSVTERTREIGIRKALGAKTRTILFQFLIESAFLTLLGGVVGIVLGLLGGWGIGNAMGISAAMEPPVIVFAVLFSVAIGIFFGIYPARKAARLNPIDALRSE